MKTVNFQGLLLSTALALVSVPVFAQDDPTAPTLITPDTRIYVYQCNDDRSFQAEYGLEMATLELEGERVMLPQIPAASGARYSNGEITLFTRGNEAFLEVGGEIVYQDCVAQTDEAETERSTTETTETIERTTESLTETVTPQTQPAPQSSPAPTPTTASPTSVPALW
jgi:membrane-bound inhibitor of C-type lysozyme